MPDPVTSEETLCLTPQQVKKAADAVRDLKHCQIDLAARQKLIHEELLASSAPSPWWQDPSVIIGGMVLSAGVGGLMFLLLAPKK